MSTNRKSRLPEILKNHEEDLLADWAREQLRALGLTDRIKEGELREQCRAFLRLLQEASQGDNLGNVLAPEWGAAREMLGEVSRSRSQQGFSRGSGPPR